MPYPEKDKRKRKVQRLVDVEVTHVSLVDRPANRTPFKAIKRDEAETKGANAMNITLKNMFGARPAGVTSVMADTKAKAIAVANSLMDSENATVEEKDGVFIVRKSGTQPTPEERVIHMGKRAGVAYTVANLKKELVLYDMEGENFDDAVKQEGFVPGLMVGMEALHTTIRNIAMAEDTSSADVFRDKVAKAMDEFGTYVDSLIDALPERAFKFEKALLSVLSPNELNATRPADGFNAEVYDAIFGDDAQSPTEGAQGDTSAAAPDDAGKPDEVTQEAAPAPAGAEQDAAAGAKDGDTAEAEASPVAAEPAPSNLEELPKGTPEQRSPTQEEIMAGLMEGLTKNVGDSIAKAMKPLTERLDVQDAAIQKMSKAVGGAVTSTPEEDNVITLEKSGGNAPGYGPDGPPLLDTAYSKRG